MLQELVFHPQISGNYFCWTEKTTVTLLHWNYACQAQYKDREYSVQQTSPLCLDRCTEVKSPSHTVGQIARICFT